MSIPHTANTDEIRHASNDANNEQEPGCSSRGNGQSNGQPVAEQHNGHNGDSAAAEQEANCDYVIICGETEGGRKFRPSDWSDRLHGALRVLGDEAEEVADMVHLVNFNNQKCIMIDQQLKNIRMEVYNFFIHFATDNHLAKRYLTEEDWNSQRN